LGSQREWQARADFQIIFLRDNSAGRDLLTVTQTNFSVQPILIGGQAQICRQQRKQIFLVTHFFARGTKRQKKTKARKNLCSAG
jgi:hypothetical protein